MVYFLCFRLVEKYFQDGGSLAIMPPTMNLSSKTIKVRKFPHQKLDFMSLFHDRLVIDHPVFMVLVVNIKFASSIRFHILAIQGIP
jgi:hypothetical protein